MAHFAELDDNNVVLRVTVVNNAVLLDENNEEQESLGLKHLEELGGRWVQTSYNGVFRKNYAGIGCTYDEQLDAFIFPQPFPSWILDEETCDWKAPKPMPQSNLGSTEWYVWNEDLLEWVITTL
jgi:hypothetical protein